MIRVLEPETDRSEGPVMEHSWRERSTKAPIVTRIKMEVMVAIRPYASEAETMSDFEVTGPTNR